MQQEQDNTKEQRKSQQIPQPQSKHLNSINADSNENINNTITNLDQIPVNPSTSFSINQSYYNLPSKDSFTIHHPEVSYSSLHNGLSSPEPNETEQSKVDSLIEQSQVSMKQQFRSEIQLNPEVEPNTNDDFVHLNLANDLPIESPPMHSQTNLMQLYHNLMNNNMTAIQQSFLFITVKSEVKDKIIGSHKVYEISQYEPFAQAKKVKCYRRYDNFSKLHNKIKGKYPYIMIPRLTPKNPLVKVLTFEEEFYENRRFQLLFYLNFLMTHNLLNKTREFDKFLNDASFDETFFNIDESPVGSSIFTPSELIKNKLITVWNYLGPSQVNIGTHSNRKLNDSEVLINKMSIHYKNIIDKYVSIKGAISDYIKSIKEDAGDYKTMSETLFYIKDCFDYVEGSKEKLEDYSQFSIKVSIANNTSYVNANRLENKLEAMISLLNGICDAFERYGEFIRRYESVVVMMKSAKEGNWENINSVIGEYDVCEILKGKFDLNLSQEAEGYIEVFDEGIMQVLEEFKMIMVNVNKKILE